MKIAQSSQTIQTSCPRCGHVNALQIGQVSVRQQLRWFESVKCDACGLTSEADGIGFPSLEVRILLLEGLGRWKVVMTGMKSIGNTVKVLRAALSIDLNEAAALAKSSSKIVYEGTKSECLWLMELLGDAGEASTLLEPVV